MNVMWRIKEEKDIISFSTIEQYEKRNGKRKGKVILLLLFIFIFFLKYIRSDLGAGDEEVDIWPIFICFEPWVTGGDVDLAEGSSWRGIVWDFGIEKVDAELEEGMVVVLLDKLIVVEVVVGINVVLLFVDHEGTNSWACQFGTNSDTLGFKESFLVNCSATCCSVCSSSQDSGASLPDITLIYFFFFLLCI